MKSRKRKKATKEQIERAKIAIESGKLWKERSFVRSIASGALEDLRSKTKVLKDLKKRLKELNKELDSLISVTTRVKNTECERSLSGVEKILDINKASVKDLKKGYEKLNYLQGFIDPYHKTIGKKVKASFELLEKLIKENEELSKDAKRKFDWKREFRVAS